MMESKSPVTSFSKLLVRDGLLLLGVIPDSCWSINSYAKGKQEEFTCFLDVKRVKVSIKCFLLSLLSLSHQNTYLRQRTPTSISKSRSDEMVKSPTLGTSSNGSLSAVTPSNFCMYILMNILRCHLNMRYLPSSVDREIFEYHTEPNY